MFSSGHLSFWLTWITLPLPLIDQQWLWAQVPFQRLFQSSFEKKITKKVSKTHRNDRRSCERPLQDAVTPDNVEKASEVKALQPRTFSSSELGRNGKSASVSTGFSIPVNKSVISTRKTATVSKLLLLSAISTEATKKTKKRNYPAKVKLGFCVPVFFCVFLCAKFKDQVARTVSFLVREARSSKINLQELVFVVCEVKDQVARTGFHCVLVPKSSPRTGFFVHQNLSLC